MVASSETLERRTLLAGDADIVWVNRGSTGSDTDKFEAIFDVRANAARAVIDAAIQSWERVITDFNYDDGSSAFELTLVLDVTGASGFGGAAWITERIGYKPSAGYVQLAPGLENTPPDGGLPDGVGYFLDPTPLDSSEFTAVPDNAYWGFTQPGSPARDLRDLFTPAAHEIGHALGLGGERITTFSTNTFVPSILAGTLWTFDGPSIKHLWNSENAGSPEQFPIHTAYRGETVTVAGTTYIGAASVMQPAVGWWNERYLVPNTSALMLKDAYGYTVADPEVHGTFYSILNQTTGELMVRGRDAGSDDVITVFGMSGELFVQVNLGDDVPGTGALPGAGNLDAFSTRYDLAEVSSIRFVYDGGGSETVLITTSVGGYDITVSGPEGVDHIGVNGLPGLPLRLDTGAEADHFTWDRMDVVNPLTIDAGPGVDTLTVNHTLAPGTARPFTFNGQGDADAVFVEKAAAGTLLTINGGAGADEIYLGFTDRTLGDIAAPVDIAGDGSDFLSLYDTSNAAAHGYAVHSNFVASNGVTRATYSGIDQVVLTAGTNNNTINVNNTEANTEYTINGHGGDDTIVIGGGNLSALPSTIHASGGDGSNDSVVFNDSAAVGIDMYSIDHFLFERTGAFGSATYTAEHVVLEAQSGPNPINLLGNSFADFFIKGNDGDDTVQLAPTERRLTAFARPVTVNGGNGNDGLILHDDLHAGATFWSATSGSIAPTSGHSFAGLSYTSLSSVALRAGTGDDVLLVDGSPTGTNLSVNGGGGNDSVWVTSASQNLDNIAGALSVSGGAGGDALIVDDQLKAGAVNYVLTGSSFTRPGFGGISYGEFDGVAFYCGSGDNDIDVNGSSELFTMQLNAGGGSDDIRVNVALRNSLLAQAGGGATPETLTFNHQNQIAATWDVSSNTVTRTDANSSAVVTYIGMSRVNINAGDAVDTFNIQSTNSFTPVYLAAGGGTDTINAIETEGAGSVMVLPSNGDDLVNVNSNGLGSANLNFIGTQRIGMLTLGNGGESVVLGADVLSVTGLNLAATALLDMLNSDLIVDYTGAPQLAAVQARINSGRNDGAWDGFGIRSGTAAANPHSNTTLGAMESSDYTSATGQATFSGQPLDPTMVLVKYTYYADTDFNGQVDFDDYINLDFGFNSGQGTWLRGDADGSGSVDFDDYTLIDLAFNTQSGIL